ncbi:MAG: sensor histidine kinase [Dehalococcoidia bacterium]
MITDEDGRRQELLDEREEQYRSLFAYNPDAIFSFDRTPRFTSANPAAERISGYTSAELLSLPPMRLVVPEHAERSLQDFRRALAGEASSDDVAIVRKDGARVELHLTLVPIRVQGEITGVFGIAQDITESRRTESERAALHLQAGIAEQRTAFLAEAGELLGSSLDFETTLASVARLAVPQLADWCAIDIREDDAIRRLVVAALDPEQEAQVRALRDRYPHDPDALTGVPAVIRTGVPEFVPDLQLDLLPGAAVDETHLQMLLALRMTSLLRVPLTARGRTFGAISLVYAGSGRHYQPADLGLTLDLARRAALAVDNARLYQEAQHAVEVRDQFLAAASHDLRTPVTTIKSYAQLLHRSLQRTAKNTGVPAPVDVVEGLAAIERAASRITGQINELLDLSRLHSGRPLELERRPVDLVALVRLAAEAQEQIAAQRRIRIEPRKPELIGLWDNVRLDRVVSNLLSNALKYSPAGGEILVTLAPASGDCCPGTSDECAVLRVQDHGIGIPARDLPHVFERFYRASNTRGRPGTGIGLAGVRDIVQQHGGTIHVESREGEGSTFTVRLPLSD